MGLVFSEVVMETEERFGIHIEDAEVVPLRTAGDFYALVLRKLGIPWCRASWAFPCPSSVAFHRIRRALIQAAGVPRRSVRPDSRLEELLPDGERRRQWAALEAAADLRLHPLERSPALDAAWLLTAAMLGAGVLAAFAGFFHQLGTPDAARALLCLLGLGVPCALLFVAGDRLALANARRIPGRCATVRLMVTHALKCQPVAGLTRDTLSPEGVWEDVCAILRSNTYRDPGPIAPDTTLADLNMD